MKICHAFIFYSVRHAGGTCDLMHKLCNYQARIGLKPVILAGKPYFDAKLAAETHGTEFVTTASWFVALGLNLMPALPLVLWRKLPDVSVVHMHAYRTFQNVVLYFFCRLKSVPFVIDAHGSAIYGTRKPLMKRLFDRTIGRMMLRDAAALIAETEVGVEEYRALGACADRITVLPPPFDTEEFEALPQPGEFRARFGFDRAKIVLFVGRINRIKGLDFLIRGFAEYRITDPDCVLAVVGGDDGHLDELKALARELGVSDAVRFVGFLSGREKLSALVDADVFAQTSRHEQGAWAPIEAVLSGTPIIVTSHTGAGEDVRRFGAGELVRIDDAADLAAALRRVFSDYPAAKERTRRARERIAGELSLSARIRDYEALYRRAAGRGA